MGLERIRHQEDGRVCKFLSKARGGGGGGGCSHLRLQTQRLPRRKQAGGLAPHLQHNAGMTVQDEKTGG